MIPRPRMRSGPKRNTRQVECKCLVQGPGQSVKTGCSAEGSGITDLYAVIPAEFSSILEAEQTRQPDIVPVFLVQIERQMNGIEGQVVFFQVQRPSVLKIAVFLRPPFDAMMHHEQVDIEFLRFFKGRYAGIDCETDFSEVLARAGTHLQTVQGSILDLLDPQRLVQEADHVLYRRPCPSHCDFRKGVPSGRSRRLPLITPTTRLHPAVTSATARVQGAKWFRQFPVSSALAPMSLRKCAPSNDISRTPL